MTETLEDQITELRELNAKLSRALAEEMASNFKLEFIRQDLQDKLDKMQNGWG